MKEQIGLINYGSGGPTIGITRYTQELISAFEKRNVPFTVIQAGRSNVHKGSVSLWGASRAPALLSIGQAEIAWHAWRYSLPLLHDPTGTVPLMIAQTRRVTTIHDAIPYIYPETCRLMVRLIYRYWLPLAAMNVDEIITVSRQSKADIVRHLFVDPNKITVIPHGVDRRYRLLDPEEISKVLQRNGITFPYILFVSSVEPRKNLLRLIEAYYHLCKWSEKWQLVVVGTRKWNSKTLSESLKRLDIEKRVHFTGFVAEEDLPGIYNGADLFILPSLYEGFGLPVLEAMACGTPVITSATSSLPEVAGNAAVLIDPCNVSAIMDAMWRVLSDPDLAAELRQRGLARAQEFTWERTAQETLAVYERALGQKFV